MITYHTSEFKWQKFAFTYFIVLLSELQTAAFEMGKQKRQGWGGGI
jgi:hypothetical protein